MSKSTLSKDVEILFEIGSLRHVARTWCQFGGVRFANVTEHSYRVAWIAMILATREKADVARVMQLALLHDLPEVRTGDTNYISRMYVARNESDALRHAAAGTSLQGTIRILWLEYEARQTLEAKIVKDADNLDCDLELSEQLALGVDLRTVLEPTRLAVYDRLYTESARQMFHEIRSANPHAWHLEGVNRLTVGDWKPRQPLQIQRELPLMMSPDEENDDGK